MHPVAIRPEANQRARSRTVVAINLFAVVAILVGIVAVPQGDRVVVVVAPWSAPGHVLDVIAHAGGRIVSGSRVQWIVVSEGSSPGYARRLFESGAAMVFDGSLLSGCQKGNDA